jgi:membrane protein YqaA with SNARE-associated domain
MDDWIPALLAALALPQYGLSTVFVIAFVSATLLPMGSEPAVFGLVKLNPICSGPPSSWRRPATRLGGALTWWMGYGAERVYERVTKTPARRIRKRCAGWSVSARGRACLSWLPIVGDPLCAVAGWMRLPFWPCVVYMAIGKFARYVTMTAGLLWFFPRNVRVVSIAS